MAIVIKPKRSEDADSAPTTSDIVDGELAINVTDKKIYIRHSNDSIVTLSDAANLTSGSTSTIDATTDIILDADGGDIFFKDDGTTFGSATNTSGNLIVKSGTTTALTFSGANVTAAGTYTGGGLLTTGGNIVVPDAGNIGSASDTDAIAIASDGVVTFSQVPLLPDDTVATADIQDSAVTLAKLATVCKNLAEDTFTGNGSTTDYTLSSAPPSDEAILVTLDGVVQPIANYSLSSTTLTMSTAPPSGVALRALHIGVTTVNALDADSVTSAKIADDAVDSEHYADGSIDTAHIADNQITLAKMAGLARGKLIYGDSSGDPAALAVGSANQVLSSDGTDVSWAAAAGTLVFLVENSVAGGVHLSTAFSSTYITSTYERYLITFQDLDFNNDNVTFYAQVSADNGSSYQTSGYRTAGYYTEYDGSSTNSTADNTANYLMAATSVGNAATESLSGHMWLINPSNSSTFAQAYWDLVYDAEDSYTRRYMGAGNFATAGAINNIKFAPSGGVWNSGKLVLYGVKNS